MDVTPLPRSRRDRRIRIRDLERKNELIKEKALFDRFMARDYFLHQKAFYDGDLVPSEIENEFSRAEGFIRDVDEME